MTAISSCLRLYTLVIGNHYDSLLLLKLSYKCLFHFTAVLDIILSWKARRSMSLYVKLRYILKALSAAAWVIILPVTYAYSWKNPPGFAQTIRSWFGNSLSSPSLFILAILIYLSPNMLSAILFMFPFIRRFLERSNYKIVMLMMWWSQVLEPLMKTTFMFLLFFTLNFVHANRYYTGSIKLLVV